MAHVQRQGSNRPGLPRAPLSPLRRPASRLRCLVQAEAAAGEGVRGEGAREHLLEVRGAEARHRIPAGGRREAELHGGAPGEAPRDVVGPDHDVVRRLVVVEPRVQEAHRRQAPRVPGDVEPRDDAGEDRRGRRGARLGEAAAEGGRAVGFDARGHRVVLPEGRDVGQRTSTRIEAVRRGLRGRGGERRREEGPHGLRLPGLLTVPGDRIGRESAAAAERVRGHLRLVLGGVGAVLVHRGRAHRRHPGAAGRKGRCHLPVDDIRATGAGIHTRQHLEREALVEQSTSAA
mmetsp:Transcript_10616/g.28833  ORF Transcript_10616/g.28833 Transcript_10616/m.28833 type:complete len:289 (+) Transcript_10616:192-1058(+)